MTDDLGFVPNESNDQPKDDGVGFTPTQSEGDDLGFVPNEPEESKYGTPGQQVLAGIEGAGQGLVGPLAPLAEKGLSALGVPGLAPEDIKSRAEANPITHGAAEAGTLAASMLLGTGEAGLIAKGASHLVPEATTMLGKAGSAFLRGAIETGALQGSDEISNAMIGRGDPEQPVAAALAHIGAASLLGGGVGSLLNVTGQAGMKGLEALENAKMGTKARNIVTGMGVAAKMKELGIPMENAEEYINTLYNPETTPIEQALTLKDLKPGINAYNTAVKGLGRTAGATIGGAAGSLIGPIAGSEGAFLGATVLGPTCERIIGKHITKANKYIIPAITKSLSEGHLNNLFTTVDYASKVAKGNTAITNAVDGLFKVGGQQLYDHAPSLKDREKLSDIIDQGGLNSQLNATPEPPQSFAEGGAVQDPDIDHFSTTFPDQSMLLGTAKSRIADYLGMQKPQEPNPTFPFDEPTKDPIQEKSYNRALDIANSPLSVFNHIKDGTIEADHVKHFSSMHPELYKTLVNRITQRVAQNKIDDEKPNYKIRQGLSMFLGQPMDSTFAPFGIQQAQSVFAPKQPQMPQIPQKSKGRPTQLKNKSTDLYKTPGQRAEQDSAERD